MRTYGALDPEAAGGRGKLDNNGKGPEQGLDYPGYQSTADVARQIQRDFIIKVYSILSLQLAATVGICWTVMAHEGINSFVLANSWLLYLALFASVGLIIALQLNRNNHPTNMYLLAAFTFCESLTVATVCAHYEAHGVGELVAVAWGITLLIFVSLTAFVFFTPWDFSFLGLFLPAGLWGMIIYSFVCLIFGIHTGYTFAFLGALLFSGFIIYDTQVIITKMGCDDYISACIELYLDIINLFLMILQLLSSDR